MTELVQGSLDLTTVLQFFIQLSSFIEPFNKTASLAPNSWHSSFLRRAVYIFVAFRIYAHAKLFGLFHLFTLFLEEFDYTARIQHVLQTTGFS